MWNYKITPKYCQGRLGTDSSNVRSTYIFCYKKYSYYLYILIRNTLINMFLPRTDGCWYKRTNSKKIILFNNRLYERWLKISTILVIGYRLIHNTYNYVVMPEAHVIVLLWKNEQSTLNIFKNRNSELYKFFWKNINFFLNYWNFWKCKLLNNWSWLLKITVYLAFTHNLTKFHQGVIMRPWPDTGFQFSQWSTNQRAAFHFFLKSSYILFQWDIKIELRGN